MNAFGGQAVSDSEAGNNFAVFAVLGAASSALGNPTPAIKSVAAVSRDKKAAPVPGAAFEERNGIVP